MDTDKRQRAREVAALFLRLGFTAFGGPAAHVAIMHDEVVKRRKWVDDQGFLDLLAAAQLIPGPNSTEMTIHLGFLRAGWPGLILAGTCFILPAMLMVTGLAWLYVRFGATPAAGWILYGIKPVIIAIILGALWDLGRRAIRDYTLAVLGAAVLAAYFLGVNEILLLALGGLIYTTIKTLSSRKPPGAGALVLPPVWGWPFAWPSLRSWLLANGSLWGLGLTALAAVPFGLPLLFLTFLKIGSVLYGSGYVLLAFLHRDFVTRLGWLTDQQLLDAVAVGQLTPGPVFTTATFIGYFLGGLPGALLATVGIFLPSFFLVALSNPLIPRLRASPVTGRFLDGVNAASLGLMAAVTFQLGRASLVDLPTVLAGVLAAGLLFRWRVSSTWLIAGGVLLGLVRFLMVN